MLITCTVALGPRHMESIRTDTYSRNHTHMCSLNRYTCVVNATTDVIYCPFLLFQAFKPKEKNKTITEGKITVYTSAGPNKKKESIKVW